MWALIPDVSPSPATLAPCMSHAYIFASVRYSLSMLETNQAICEASQIQVHPASAQPWVLFLVGKCAAGHDLLQESRAQNACALRIALLLNPYSVLKFYFIYLCICVCLLICMYTTHVHCVGRPEEGIVSPALEFQVVVSCLMWVLGIESRSYARAASALNQ